MHIELKLVLNVAEPTCCSLHLFMFFQTGFDILKCPNRLVVNELPCIFWRQVIYLHLGGTFLASLSRKGREATFPPNPVRLVAFFSLPQFRQSPPSLPQLLSRERWIFPTPKPASNFAAALNSWTQGEKGVLREPRGDAVGKWKSLPRRTQMNILGWQNPPQPVPSSKAAGRRPASWKALPTPQSNPGQICKRAALLCW